MNAFRNPGRIAGLWYLLIVLIGPLRLIYIPAKLFVDNNPSATADNILAHQVLFRCGIAADLIGAIALVMLSLALYRLFRETDERLAVQVVIFGGVMPALLYLVNSASDLGYLMIVNGQPFLSAFSKPQQDGLAMLLLRLHDQQNHAAEVLWGTWLIPLAVLAYRSRLVPRLIAAWLFLAGCGWLALCFTSVLAPRYNHLANTASQPATLGEIAFMLWLVVRGSRTPSSAGAAAINS
jgi:hypothetical protein